MSRYFFILISIFLFAIKGYSQVSGPNADSLKTALKGPALPDTSKAWLLLQLTNAVFTSIPDEAMKFCVPAESLAGDSAAAENLLKRRVPCGRPA